MAEFTYEALDRGGKQVKGSISASNEDMVVEKLHSLGMYPLKVAPLKVKAGDFDLLTIPGIKIIAHRIKTKHVMTFTRQLATLIDAGLPILRSLAILTEQVESVIFKEKIQAMAKDIEQGSTLSDAMAKHPKVFDKLYVNMVRAGEIGGVLEAVLNKIAAFLEKRQALKSKVKSAMMYPVVVMLVAALIVGFILWKIIPKFIDIFQQLGAGDDMPELTMMLVHASDYLREHTIMVIIWGVLIYQGIKLINRTTLGKLTFDTIKLRMPIFGQIMRKVAIVRFAGTLSTLITSGVPILQALEIVRNTSGNEVVSRAVAEVYESVKDGDTIHEPLSRCEVFPPLVVHMVAVGEETGAIDQMLQKVAEAYEREVDDTVDALTSIIEPVMIVFLGVIIGVIVVALYLPLFELPKKIGQN